MSIQISGYSFEGPFASSDYLKNLSGVYAVLKNTSGSYQLVDVGESGMIKIRIEQHDRKNCWLRQANSRELHYAAYYCNESQRMIMEAKIRKEYSPPCGKY